jgi:hypothetical protein
LASNEDINKELLSRTYEELSEEFKEKVVRAVELVPMMYNRLTIIDKMPHNEAIKKIIDDHRQVHGFSSRNIIRYLPPDNPSVPHRVTTERHKSISTPNNTNRKLSDTELQKDADEDQSQNGEDKIQSMDYNELSNQNAELSEAKPKKTTNVTDNKIPSKGLEFKIFKEKYGMLYMAMNRSNEYIRIEFDFYGTFERAESDVIK